MTAHYGPYPNGGVLSKIQNFSAKRGWPLVTWPSPRLHIHIQNQEIFNNPCNSAKLRQFRQNLCLPKMPEWSVCQRYRKHRCSTIPVICRKCRNGWLSIPSTIPADLAKLQTCWNCRRYWKPRFPAFPGDLSKLQICQNCRRYRKPRFPTVPVIFASIVEDIEASLELPKLPKMSGFWLILRLQIHVYLLFTVCGCARQLHR